MKQSVISTDLPILVDRFVFALNLNSKCCEEHQDIVSTIEMSREHYIYIYIYMML